MVTEALEALEPSLVADQLFDLASAFDRHYTLGNTDPPLRILVAGELGLARRALTRAVQLTLRAGLHLLGMPIPEAM